MAGFKSFVYILLPHIAWYLVWRFRAEVAGALCISRKLTVGRSGDGECHEHKCRQGGDGERVHGSARALLPPRQTFAQDERPRTCKRGVLVLSF